MQGPEKPWVLFPEHRPTGFMGFMGFILYIVLQMCEKVKLSC